MVAVAIIGLLSSVVLAALDGARESARDARRASDLHQIQNALELFRDVGGLYPATPSPSYVSSLTIAGSDIRPYIGVIPTDPTQTGGNGYRYSAGPDRRSYTLMVVPESTGSFCKIVVPPGNAAWAGYPDCAF